MHSKKPSRVHSGFFALLFFVVFILFIAIFERGHSVALAQSPAANGPWMDQTLSPDRRADLALLRVPPVEITPAASTDSDALRVGALVVAVGHPLGLRRTLTAGVVHGFPPARSGSRWIQADLRLAPGNSGGPLADTTGRVVGINTMIAGGLALAIPINDVRRFVAASAVAVT